MPSQGFPTNTAGGSAEVIHDDTASATSTAITMPDDLSASPAVATSLDIPDEPKERVSATKTSDATVEIPCFGPVLESNIHLPLRYQAVAFLVTCLVALFLMCMILTVTTWRYPNPKTNPQLPDLALDNLPEIPALEHVTDGIIGALTLMCFGVIFAVWLIAHGRLEPRDRAAFEKLFPTSDSVHLIPWIRFFVCYTSITLIRIVVLACTVLPATDNKCQTRPSTGNFWWNAAIGVLTFGAKNVHCGDLLFSGHTSVITLCVCAVWTYGPLVHRFLRPTAASLMILSWFTILLSRSHYTDDIIIALYIAITLWKLTPHCRYGAPTAWQMAIQLPSRWLRLA